MSEMPPPPIAAQPGDEPGVRPGVHLSHRQILIIFSGLMLGMFLSALDNTIVTTALPSIVGDLGGQSQTTWVVTSYLLTSTITILMWGRLSDIYGRKLLFQISIAAFLAASALVGLANSMMFLVLARGLQGIGAGGIMSLAFAIIGDILSPRERGKYMGLMGSVFVVAMIVGPLIGGLIVEHLHIGSIAPWRWIFYINLPLGIPALFITGIVLRLPFHRQPGKVDYLGFALMALGTCAMILGLIWAGQPASWANHCAPGHGPNDCYNLRWFPGVGDAAPLGGAGPTDSLAQAVGDWLIPTLLAVGAITTVLFVVSQTKVKQPLLPLRLFKTRTYTLGSIVSFVVGAAMFGGFVFLPTFLQISTGVSATLSGLLMLPLMAGMFPFMTASGILVSRTGRYKVWPLVGLPVGAAGLLWLSTIHADSPLWYVGFGMFLLGAGIGMTMQVIVVAVQNVLDMRDLGIGTSANTFLRQMGGVFGIGLFGAYYASRVIGLIPGALQIADKYPDVDKGPILAGFQVNPQVVHNYPDELRIFITGGFADTVAHIFLYAAPIMLLGWLAILFLKEVPLRTTRNVGAAAMEAGEGMVPAADGPVAPAVAADRGLPPNALARVSPRPGDAIYEAMRLAPRPASVPYGSPSAQPGGNGHLPAPRLPPMRSFIARESATAAPLSETDLAELHRKVDRLRDPDRARPRPAGKAARGRR